MEELDTASQELNKIAIRYAWSLEELSEVKSLIAQREKLARIDELDNLSRHLTGDLYDESDNSLEQNRSILELLAKRKAQLQATEKEGV